MPKTKKSTVNVTEENSGGQLAKKKAPAKRNNARTGTKNSDEPLLQQVSAMNAILQQHAEVIDSLKGIPSALSDLAQLIHQNQNLEDSSNLIDYPNDEAEGDSDDAFSNLLTKAVAGEASDSLDTTESQLLDILNTNQPEPEYGADLQKDVAESFLRIQLQKVTKEKMDKWKQIFKVPSNCRTLGVPRVNAEIWSALPAKIRQTDFQSQSVQQFVSLTSVALAKLAEKVFETSKDMKGSLGQEILKMVMEAASMNGLIMQDINCKRKQNIKPSLNKDVASICSANIGVTEFLFGDNLSEQLKSSRATANVMKSSVGTGSRGGRFFPYNNFGSRGKQNHLNFRRASFQQRGGIQPRPNQFSMPYRGRGSRRGLPQTQPQHQY